MTLLERTLFHSTVARIFARILARILARIFVLLNQAPEKQRFTRVTHWMRVLGASAALAVFE